MPDCEVTAVMVDYCLTRIDVHKSVGPDGINPKILHVLAPLIVELSTSIMNLSLKYGEVLVDWKTAEITRIHKKGHKHQTLHYHPVNLTSIVHKIYEHVVHDAMLSHLPTLGL